MAVQLISFDVPQVLVPDTFTWTLQVITNTTPAVGLVDGGPPTIGSSPNFYWFGNTHSWGQAQYPALMASVEAVPEPSPNLLLFSAAILFAFRKRTGSKTSLRSLGAVYFFRKIR